MTPTRPIVLCAGAAVLNKAKLLVVLRSNEPFAGRWSLPGGRVETGESLVHAARREVREETGLDVKIGRFIGWVEFDGANGELYRIAGYEAKLRSAAEKAQASSDAQRVAFFSADELAGLDLSDGLLEWLVKNGILHLGGDVVG